MAKIDDIIKEINEYTDYCKLIEYQMAKAEEYVDKAIQQGLSALGLATAAFPMVGPAIIATKAAVVQAAMAIEEPLEAAAVVVASVAKLVEVGLPVDGCPNTTPPIPPLI